MRASGVCTGEGREQQGSEYLASQERNPCPLGDWSNSLQTSLRHLQKAEGISPIPTGWHASSCGAVLFTSFLMYLSHPSLCGEEHGSGATPKDGHRCFPLCWGGEAVVRLRSDQSHWGLLRGRLPSPATAHWGLLPGVEGFFCASLDRWPSCPLHGCQVWRGLGMFLW